MGSLYRSQPRLVSSPPGTRYSKRVRSVPLQAKVSNQGVLWVKTKKPRHIASAFRVLRPVFATSCGFPTASPLASRSRPETITAAVRPPKIEPFWANVSVSLLDLRVRVMSQARNCRAPHILQYAPEKHRPGDGAWRPSRGRVVNNEENSGVHPKHCSPNRRATGCGHNVCSSLCDAAFRKSRATSRLFGIHNPHPYPARL